MNHGSLFSGIGGFDLAAEWMGWENVFHCEWDEFGQRILKYYWPNAISYGDITATDFTIHRGKIDIITGGFPCQPFSTAGNKKGTDDGRYLWPEMLRAIRESKPPFVVAENVTGILNMEQHEVFARMDSHSLVRFENYDEYEAIYTRQATMLINDICTDLEKEGYAVQPLVIPAAGVGAPHRRDRVWIIAYSNGAIKENKQRENTRKKGKVRRNKKGDVLGKLFSDEPFTDTFSGKREKRGNNDRMGREREQIKEDRWYGFPIEHPICSGNDGISYQLDGITFSKWRKETLKGYGNAIVPQVVYEIFKAISHS